MISEPLAMTEPHQPHDAGSIRSHSSVSSSGPVFEPTRSHASRSRRRSRSDAASRSRSRSRPASPSNIDRVPSGRYIDDQSVYYLEYNPTRRSSAESEENVIPDRELSEFHDEKDAEPVLEERDGIVNERDVDLEPGAQRIQSNLEKSKTRGSTRSQYDSKLVRNLSAMYI